MKLNPDCIRDILMSVEEVTAPFTRFEYEKDKHDHKKLVKYTHDEILYHIQQCYMASLITGYKPFDAGDYVVIGDLAPAGHEFLANVRKESIWNKTKSISSKIGSGSLSTITQIAAQVVAELVKAQFGIT